MYKPLPQILTGNEGEEEEDSELYSSSFLDTEHYKYPSAEEMNDAGTISLLINEYDNCVNLTSQPFVYI